MGGTRCNFWFWGINLVITIGKCAIEATNFVGLPHAFASDVIAFEEGMCMFTSNLFENGWDLVFIMWGMTRWHVCEMWEHGTSLEIVQWDAISKYGDLDQQNIMTHAKMKARPKGIITIWVQPKGVHVAKLYCFCEVIECMCQCSCVWSRHVCSWVDHWKWSSMFDAFVGNSLVAIYAMWSRWKMLENEFKNISNVVPMGSPW